MKRVDAYLFALTLTLVCGLVPTMVAADDDSKYKLEYLKFQVAGNIGLAAIGTGKHFLNNRLEADIWYGFVPEQVGGTDIHTFAIKTQYSFAQTSTVKTNMRMYAGTMISHVVGRHYFSTRFEETEFDYYPWTAVHIMPYVGIRRQIENGAGLFAEVGSLDVYLVQYVMNTQTMGLADALNLSVGIYHPF